MCMSVTYVSYTVCWIFSLIWPALQLLVSFCVKLNIISNLPQFPLPAPDGEPLPRQRLEWVSTADPIFSIPHHLRRHYVQIGRKCWQVAREWRDPFQASRAWHYRRSDRRGQPDCHWYLPNLSNDCGGQWVQRRCVFVTVILLLDRYSPNFDGRSSEGKPQQC